MQSDFSVDDEIISNVKVITDFSVDDLPTSNHKNTQIGGQNKKAGKKVVKGLKLAATNVKKAIEHKKSVKNGRKNSADVNQNLNYVGAIKKGLPSNQKKDAVDKTYNSHPNRSAACVKGNKMVDNASLYSTIASESDWENNSNRYHHRNKRQQTGTNIFSNTEISDGPLKLAENPYKKYTEKEDKTLEKRAPLLPQRHWEKENVRSENNYQVNNNYPMHSQPADYSVPSTSRGSLRPNAPQKPITIREVTPQISSIGEEDVEDDGFQVKRSSAYMRKMKRLKELENNENNKGLKSAKAKVKTRFVLTLCDPETTEEDIELELLKWFEEFEHVFVRKNEMKKHNSYATFVFIVTSENELDIKMIEDSDWLRDVRCFFAPNNERYRR